MRQRLQVSEHERDIWPDVAVTEESLTRCISDVRIALQYIERSIVRTVPKLGYMLDTTVTTAVEEQANRQQRAECASSIPGTPAAASDSGRRQATVVFVDIHDAVEALSDSDPEAALTAYDGAITLVAEIPGRYGATLQVVPGVGALGLFGVPAALEDHALRACHAAVECQQAVTTWPAASHAPLADVFLPRIGVASSNITFRNHGGTPGRQWSAVGPALAQPKRLGRAALPGTSLIAAETKRLVDGQVVVSIKSFAEGVYERGWRLDGQFRSASRFKAGNSPELSRFVGRDTELEQLRRTQELASRGHGQIVAIVGEAGVGKSRLVHEFVKALDATSRHRILSCNAVSYGLNAGFLPLINLLRDYFKVEPRDDVLAIRNKIVTNVLALDPEMKSGLPALLSLLDVPDDDASWLKLDPGERRRRTLVAVKQLLALEARAQPLILIIEDLHWVDAQTQALLDTVIDSLPSSRLMIIATYRAEYRHGWGNRSTYRQLRLDSLAPDDTSRLLDDRLGDDAGVERLKQLMRRRGNPFFLEEAILTLLDTGTLVGERGSYRLTRDIDAIQLPPTAQAILAARIDRLEPEVKRLLQVASVIGKTFSVSLLAEVATGINGDLARTLHKLQTAELITLTEFAPDAEYRVRHALTHEVSYAGMLRADQCVLHARIAEAMETSLGERLLEQIERVAHHAYRGEMGDKAVQHLRQAGSKAAGRSALTEARMWLEQSLDALGRLDESKARLELGYEIRLELRAILYQIGDGQTLLKRLREGEAIAARLRDDCRRSRVAAFMTSAHTMLGQLDDAVEIGERSIAMARALDDVELRTNAANYLVQAHYYRGDYLRAIELASETLATWPVDWAHRYHVGNPAPPSVFNRAFLTMSFAQLGRFSEAAAHEAEAIELAEPTQNAFTIAMAHTPSPFLFTLQGDWSTARDRLERYISVARTGNIIGLLSNAVAAYAWVMAELGDRAEAERRLQGGHGLLDRQAPSRIGNLCWPYYCLGRTCLILGRTDESSILAERALAMSATQPGFAAHALDLLGDLSNQSDPFLPS